MSEEHPLSNLHREKIGRFSIHLGELSKGRAKGENRFDLYLRGEDGEIMEQPAASGLYFRGMGRYYRPWIEFSYSNSFTRDGEEIALTLEEEEALFISLCSTIPAGSHIMVKYRQHRMTAQGLLFGIPPAATPIGYLMYVGGCRWYKDWYFAEGFMEGEEKLQATKPLDEEREREKADAIREELRRYLELEPDPSKPELEETCRKLARRILERDA
jgi:hypothetical protein